MNRENIATRYARAIWRYTVRQNCSKRLYRELDRLTDAFERNPASTVFLADPRISTSLKHTRLCKLIDKEVSDGFSRVIKLILQNKHTDNLYTIARLYCDRYRRKNGICRLRLLTAEILTMDETEQIRTFAKKRLQARQVELESSTCSELIGGFRLETKEGLLDASISRRLEVIRQKLESLNS